MVEVYSGRVTLPVSRTSPRMLAALGDALRGQTVKGVRIHDVTVELTDGAEGETTVLITVLVDDPEPGHGTWPVEASRAIDWRARQEAWALGIEEWVYVSFVGISEATEDVFPADSIARARVARR